MGLISVALTFVGYVLVYASVANHGRFATSPWAGAIADAYEETGTGFGDIVGSGADTATDSQRGTGLGSSAGKQAGSTGTTGSGIGGIVGRGTSRPVRQRGATV